MKHALKDCCINFSSQAEKATWASLEDDAVQSMQLLKAERAMERKWEVELKLKHLIYGQQMPC